MNDGPLPRKYMSWSTITYEEKWLDFGCMLKTELKIYTDQSYIVCKRKEFRTMPRCVVWITGGIEMTLPEIGFQGKTRSLVFT